MKPNTALRILAAAAMAAIALSLTQCILVPFRRSGPDSDFDSGKTSVQPLTPAKNNELKPVSPPQVVYRIGETVSLTGTMRQDWGGYFVDDENSSASFRFVGNKGSEADAFRKVLNRRVHVRVKLLSVNGNVFQVDFISF